MGKHMKETLVGIFIIAGIVVFIILYIWLSGRIGLRNTYDVVVYFEDVTGLRIGDPVTVFGIEKGKVKSLEIDRENVKTIIALDRDIILPKDTKIVVRSVSYVGSDRYVKITPGRDEEIPDVYYGVSEALDLESMATQFDSLFTSFKNFNMGELTEVAAELSRNIDKNITRLVDMMQKPTSKIDAVVEKTEDVVEELDSLIMLLKGDGAIGKLLTSDELYEEVRQTNLALKDLLEDIKENPKRYINIKVF
ncbi:MCE family protein [candidate division WOR-3 bacterium]|nr:MCE family protein [candidate division WOR-3 bacterium]